jgi:hypothetical protein
VRCTYLSADIAVSRIAENKSSVFDCAYVYRTRDLIYPSGETEELSVEGVAKGGKYLFPVSRQFMAFETVKEDGSTFWCKESS